MISEHITYRNITMSDPLYDTVVAAFADVFGLSKGRIDYSIRREDTPVLLFMFDGKPCAVAQYSVFDKYMFIYFLTVLQEFRNKGLGKQILHIMWNFYPQLIQVGMMECYNRDKFRHFHAAAGYEDTGITIPFLWTLDKTIDCFIITHGGDISKEDAIHLLREMCKRAGIIDCVKCYAW